MNLPIKRLAFCIFTLLSTRTFAEDPSWYSKAYGGANFFNEKTTDVADCLYNVEVDPGFIAGVSLGKYVTSNIHIEGDLCYRENPLVPIAIENFQDDKGYIFDEIGLSGKLRQSYLMANLLRDWSPTNWLSTYAGIGGGYYTESLLITARSVFDGHETSDSSTTPAISGLATQGLLGLRTHLWRSSEIGAEYRGIMKPGSFLKQNALALNCSFNF